MLLRFCGKKKEEKDNEVHCPEPEAARELCCEILRYERYKGKFLSFTEKRRMRERERER